MTVEEKQIGRIKAILGASEDVIVKARKFRNDGVVSVAKETAYDHIKGILEDVGYCPWAE